MRAKIYLAGFAFFLFLSGFRTALHSDVVTVAQKSEGTTLYTLKCNKTQKADKSWSYQYFLEVTSDKDPRASFGTNDEFVQFTSFHLNALFNISVNDTESKMLGCRMEPSFQNFNIYRFVLFFENDDLKKIKKITLEFNDKLFENKLITLTNQKLKR